eukprot:2979539-Rhodomonas_salina.2
MLAVGKQKLLRAGLEDVSHGAFEDGAVLEGLTEDLPAVAGVEGHLATLGITVGAQVLGLAGSDVAVGVMLHHGGPFHLVEQAERW